MPRHFKLAIALALAVAVAVGFGRLKLRTDVLDLLPASLPEVAGLKAFLEHFTQRDELILTLIAPDADTAAAAAESLAAALNAAPGLARDVAFEDALAGDPSRAAELIAYLLLNRPPEDTTRLVERLSPENIDDTLLDTIDELEAGLDLERVLLLSYDPFGIVTGALDNGLRDTGDASEFSSADGTFRVLYVLAGTPLEDYDAMATWLAEVRSVITSWEQDEPDLTAGISVALTGEPVFATEIATGMERDMKRSAITTLLIVSAVFLVFFRRLLPLGALVTAVGITLLLTVAAAGLLLGGLTVVSLGFASILIGLAVDYGLLIYNRAVAQPGVGAVPLRRTTTPGIAYAAATTAAAFFALAAAGLPALTELGVLVGLGILAGAVVMLVAFTPVAAKLAARAAPPFTLFGRLATLKPVAAIAGLLLVVLAAGVAARGLPVFEFSSGSLRPRHSEAYETLDLLEQNLAGSAGSTNVIVQGDDIGAVRATLVQLQEAAPERAFVPLAFWPNPAHQQQNIDRLATLAAAAPRLESAVAAAGFEPEAFSFTGSVLAQWASWSSADVTFPVLPTSPAATRLFQRFTAIDPSAPTVFALARLPQEHTVSLPDDVLPADWSRLSRRLAETTRTGMFRMLAVLSVAVLIALFIAFRRPVEIGLALLVVGIDLIALLGAMAWLGIGWNFVNLGALLLALGAGLDYSIHMLYAFREHPEDVPTACNTTGTALLVCALSTVAGFGTLAFASNLGLASLGLVCALALAINALTTLFLLPSLAHPLLSRYRNGLGG